MTARMTVPMMAAALALAWQVPLAAGGAPPPGAQYEVRVTGSRVNVRAQPTTKSEVLFQVTRGETLHLVETTERWYLVQSPDDRRGYIHKTLVELVELPPEVASRGSARFELPAEAASPVAAGFEEPATLDEEIAEAQAKSWAEKKRRRGFYKLVGGGAGVVAGFAVLGSSKPAGLGLVGAGSYFLWDGYSDRQEAGRRLRWSVLLQMNRDVKGVAYHMSW